MATEPISPEERAKEKLWTSRISTRDSDEQTRLKNVVRGYEALAVGLELKVEQLEARLYGEMMRLLDGASVVNQRLSELVDAYNPEGAAEKLAQAEAKIAELEAANLWPDLFLPPLPPLPPPPRETARVRLLFAWYDCWVGLYWDRSKATVYFFPLPMLGLAIELPQKRTTHG